MSSHASVVVVSITVSECSLVALTWVASGANNVPSGASLRPTAVTAAVAKLTIETEQVS